MSIQSSSPKPVLTSSRILSRPVKPRKPVEYRKPVNAGKLDLPINHYEKLLFKPVSLMVQDVVLPSCYSKFVHLH